MRETVILNGTEQQRLVVLNRVLVGDLTAAEAATPWSGRCGRCGGCWRRIERRAPPPWPMAIGDVPRLMPWGRRQSAGGALARAKYAGLNDTHLREVLEEREGMVLSRSTVRRLRLEAGLRPTAGRDRRPTASDGNAGPGRDAAATRCQSPCLAGGPWSTIELDRRHRRCHRDHSGRDLPPAGGCGGVPGRALSDGDDGR